MKTVASSETRLGKAPLVDQPTHLYNCLAKCGEAKPAATSLSPTNVANLDKFVGKVRPISIFTCVLCPCRVLQVGSHNAGSSSSKASIVLCLRQASCRQRAIGPVRQPCRWLSAQIRSTSC